MPALNDESPFKDDKSYGFVCSYQKAIDENPLSPTTEIRRNRCERVIDEIIATEHSYINDLSQIITVRYCILYFCMCDRVCPIYVCLYVCIYVLCTYLYITYTHTYIHACTHTYTCTHMKYILAFMYIKHFDHYYNT